MIMFNKSCKQNLLKLFGAFNMILSIGNSLYYKLSLTHKKKLFNHNLLNKLKLYIQVHISVSNTAALSPDIIF